MMCIMELLLPNYATTLGTPRWQRLMLYISTLFLIGFTVSSAILYEARETSICSYLTGATGNLNDESCFLQDLSSAVGVDVDVRDEMLFFSDISKGTLRKVRIGDELQPVQRVFHGLGRVEDIAVDWLTKNLYWTDFLLGHVSVARYDGTRRSVLVKDQKGPRSIVVHPARGLMFWTNVGDTMTPGTVMRADLAGNNQRILVANGLISPSGLAIDFPANRLYYADKGTERIESVKLGGSKRELVYQADFTGDFFDMTIFAGFLFATRWSASDEKGYITAVEIPTYPQSSSYVLDVMDIDEHTGKALGITTFDEERQGLSNGGLGLCGANNGGCDHLCMPVTSTLSQCACATGYTLDDDGVSCNTELVDTDFILFIDSSLATIFQGSLDTRTNALRVSAVDIEGLAYPVDVAFDPVESKVYWTDRATKRVNRAHLSGTDYEIVAGRYTDVLAGIELDVLRRQVFWVDEGRKTINAINMDLTDQRVVIDDDLALPRALTLNPLSGEIFWTDWRQPAKIEKANMDGSNRQAIVSRGLGWPTGMTIDVAAQELFWCDAKNDIIEMSDLDGNNRRVLVYLATTAHPFGLSVTDEHIYWSDFTERAIYRADRLGGIMMMLATNDTFLKLEGMCSFSVSYPLDATIAPDGQMLNDDATGNISTLIAAAAAAGGGIGFIATIFIATLVVCKRNSKKSNTRSRDSHTTAKQLPPTYPAKIMSDSPLPQCKLKPQDSWRDNGDHIYEDLDEVNLDSDVYLNPMCITDDSGGKPSYTVASQENYMNMNTNTASMTTQGQHSLQNLYNEESPQSDGEYLELQKASRLSSPLHTSKPVSDLCPPKSSNQTTHSALRPPASPRPTKAVVSSNWPPKKPATKPPPPAKISKTKLAGKAPIKYKSPQTENEYASTLPSAPKPQ